LTRRAVIKDLEADNQILLDFIERLIADRDEMDQRYLRLVGKEDQILEAEFVE
jgi:hypothetical protein